MESPGKFTRRHLLGAAVPAAVGLTLKGDTTCGGANCTSQVAFAEFAQDAFSTQRKSEWCWAACLSMIFTFYEHPVAQERIVTEVYGSAINMPALYAVRIARLLNRTWKDDNGKRFRATLTGAYDSVAGVDDLDNDTLISELDQDHPAIMAARGHAMVLTMMGYTRLPIGGVRVNRCGVFDPLPGRGARNLNPDETVATERGGTLTFVATASISDID